ncbi:Fes1-domain-containing protein [Auriculariales sp. MPI-PUGE-AT-0066]|nr:Fes1-domain-containing protein [Auriculariales sp. MPI-PUGE-AT-0066]
MQSLLRWGIENSDPEQLREAQTAPRQPLDPAIIDHILGKPDAVRMKESLEVAVDDTKTEDERVAALDELEMLIESIDNANDMTVLNMWTPLLSLLNSESDHLVVNTLWVLGTAIQNNPKAQADFLARDPLPLLVTALSNNRSVDVQAKALYCISGALKFSEPAVERLTELNGWSALKAALQHTNMQIRRKAAFILNSLLLPAAPSTDTKSQYVLRLTSTASTARAAILEHDLLPVLLNGVSDSEEPDEDLAEKTVRVLLMFAQAGGMFKGEVRDRLNTVVRKRAGADVWGLTAEEWDELRRYVL